MPSLENLKESTEKVSTLVEWLVSLIQQKKWVSLLILLDVVLFLFASPSVIQTSLQTLNITLPATLNDYTTPLWAGILVTIFALALFIASRSRPKAHFDGLALDERSPIKGLRSFSSADANLFQQMGRNRDIRDLLATLTETDYPLIILSGESGCGKSSFLQAGIGPSLEQRDHSSLYIQCNELQPLDSIRYAIQEQYRTPYDTLTELDLSQLLTQAAEQNTGKKLVLILDQFEQFFTHQSKKKARQEFITSLKDWYQQKPQHPVKIVLSLRSDLVGRMSELQKALSYSLSPNQNTMLEKFEPSDAAKVFQIILNSEQIQGDAKFIETLCEKELANQHDGLVSPVDLQILAWIVAKQSAEERRHFNNTTLQRLGGLEGLLNRFLEQTLKSRETSERRKSCLKVLLALIDLDSNLRAGVLTAKELKNKLADSLKNGDVSEAIEWLSKPEVRLITPRKKGDEAGFELAHERLIPAIRRLAGKTLTAADQANQLLQQRVNEWLSNDRLPRYHFSRAELRKINRQKAYLTWGKQQKQKKELLSLSQKRYTVQNRLAVGIMLLSLIGYILNQRPEAQMYWLKEELVELNHNLKSAEQQQQSAITLSQLGDLQRAIKLAQGISDARHKVNTLQALATTALTLKETDLTNTLLQQAITAAQRLSGAEYKANTLQALAKTALILKETALANTLLQQAITAAQKISDSEYKARTLKDTSLTEAQLQQLITDTLEISDKWSKPKAETLQTLATTALTLNAALANALLQQIITAAQGISDSEYKAETLQALATTALTLNAALANALLQQIITAAQGISDSEYKAEALQALATTALTLKDTALANALLQQIITAAQGISDSEYKAETLQTLATMAVTLKDSALANALLQQIVTAAQGISYAKSKAWTLQTLATMAVTLKDSALANTLLQQAITAAQRISNAKSKARTLQTLATMAVTLKDSALANTLLQRIITAAHRISHTEYKANTLQALATTALTLKDTTLANILLQQAITAAQGIYYARNKAITLLALTTTALTLKDAALVNTLLQQIITASQGISDAGTKVETLQALATTALTLKDAALTNTLLQQAIIAAQGISDTQNKAWTLQALATTASILKDAALANTLLQQAITAAQGIPDAVAKAETLSALAKTASTLKDAALANTLLQQAIIAAQGISYAESKAKTLISLSEIKHPTNSTLWLNSINKAANTINNTSKRAKVRVELSKQATLLHNWVQARNFADQIKTPETKITALNHILRAWGEHQNPTPKPTTKENDNADKATPTSE